MTKLEMMMLKRLISSDAVYRYALGVNMTGWFRRDIQDRADRGENIIVSICGDPGIGKSTIDWVIGEWSCAANGTSFGSEWVGFDDAETLALLEKAKRGNFVMKDEQIKTLGEGSSYMDIQRANIEATVRRGMVSLGYCSPGLVLHSHHYVIQPFLRLWEKKMVTLSWLFKGQMQFEGKNPIGIIKTGLPEGTKLNMRAAKHRDRVLWPSDYQAYLRRKDDYIIKVKSGEGSSGSMDLIDKLAEDIVKSDIFPVPTLKRLNTLVKTNPKWNKNLTLDMMKTLVDLVIVKAEKYGIDVIAKREVNDG